ncbi:uncharacterized protein LOC125492635 [Beta vulgaris subsp. vulgaris]|nr:uncharacterized protein LOC125492635 [Beta vulgaris subsp. vulgaris]
MESYSRDWMLCKKNDPKYRTGVKKFLEFAFTQGKGNQVVPCPCVKCNNERRKTRPEIELDLLKFGIVKSYTRWVRHGESFECQVDANALDDSHQNIEHNYMSDMLYEAFGMATQEVDAEVGEAVDAKANVGIRGDPIEEAKTFYKLMEELELPLYPGCKNFSKLSFLLKLFHIKCLGGITDKSLSMILDLENEYEKLRLQRIEANNTKLENLGVKHIMASMKQKKEVSMIKSKATLDEDSDYSPEDDLSDDGNDEEATIANKKRKAHNQDCANKGTKRNFILPGAIGSLLTQSKNVQGKGNKGGNVQLTAALKVIQKAINSQQEAEVQDKMDFDEEMKESDEIGKADVGDSEFHERESDGINARESQKAIDQEGNAKTKKSYKTKTPRGPTRNLQLAKMRPGEKIKVDFDVSGQPIGVNRAKLSSYCGSLVRDPLNAPLYRIEEFSQVPQENKEKMWKLILDKFDIGLDDVKDQDEREKKIKDKRKYIMTSLNKKYRNFRARLKREYYDTEENDDDRLKEDNRPPSVDEKDWEWLVSYFGTPDFQKKSRRNIENRSYLDAGHTAGTKSFAQKAQDMFERDKVMPGLLELYEETHTRSDKTPVTQSAQDTMNEIKQLVEQRNNWKQK